MKLRRRLGVAGVLVLITAAWATAAGTTLPPGFTETIISSDLFLPTGFAFTPGWRLLVIEKGGIIKIVSSGIARVAGKMAVSAQYDETGLLGIAGDPDFASNGYIYVYYTTSPGSYQPPNHPYRFAWNRVSRLTVSGDSVVSDSEVVLLDDIFADTEDEPTTTRHGPPHSGHHNGGGLLFGPDGKLYISVGDAQNGANAQNLSVLNGKILRINPDGSIPGDNPFVSTPGARPEIWCLGLRNPWRFTFDALGQMFIGDVGSDLFEEINVGGAGLNFGWPFYEGVSGDPRYADPLYAYPNDKHNTAIAAVGAHNGNGTYPAQYSNVLFFGDFGQGLIHTIKQDPAGVVVVTPFATNAGSPVHFAQGPDGRMYYLSLIPPQLRRIDFGIGLINIRVAAAIGGVVTTDPEGLACGPDCRAFAPGQVVTLRPAALDGRAFAGWVGHPSCSNGKVTVVEGLSCTAIFQPSATNPLVTRHGVDLSGDGTGDALFYNRTSGDWSMAFSNGAGAFNFLNGTWSPNWSITAGDFNGSMLTDFFLYNRETGQWVMAISTSAGGFSYLPGLFSPGWLGRSARLDLDAIDDLFLYDVTTGAAFECFSDGTGRFKRFVQLSLTANMEPSIIDVDGNGLNDVLLYSAASGQWLLYRSTGTGDFTLSSGAWSPGARITSGDFNGDGLDDLFLYNPVSGQWLTALSLGTGQFRTRAGTWSPSWVIARARLRRGAQDDLFLFNPETGQWFQCFTDGAGDFNRYLTERWSPGWQVFTTDLNGDGADDILLYNTSSGLYFQCITAPTGGIASYHRSELRPGFSIVATR